MEIDVKQAICSMYGQIKTVDIITIIKTILSPLIPMNVIVLLAIILVFTYTSLSSLIITDNRISKIRLMIYSAVTYLVLMLCAFYFIFNSMCQ